ncbi:MAG: hypothetical protein GC157_16665 [Frankiales bacterium]|nr:hypothetical protein [Frankiales bacterium]
MSTPTPAQRAGIDEGRAAALVAGLVDDAAVFPPAATPVHEALPAHRGHRRSSHDVVVGPFLAPVSRLGEVLDALDAETGSDPLDLVLVADTGLVEAAEARAVLLDDDRVELVGLELALPVDGPLADSARLTLATLDFAVPAAVEVPLVAGWQEAVEVIAADGAERVKIRTGGATAAHHPSEELLADVLVACVRAGARFKLTAGLHHALRRTAEGTGFEEHGFLNVLAATARAIAGDTAAEVAQVLALRTADPLLDALAGADARAVRGRFTSFGSCSISDPVTDLRSLGLLDDDPEER